MSAMISLWNGDTLALGNPPPIPERLVTIANANAFNV
jgi:hypothetical protein